ncbi:AAA family ATPase, partial [Fusobacterium polymorphum]
LFFVGPTGVGKTELAKSLASFIFGDENACIRFDMSEYNHEHSDQRLVGAPPGYVGYEAGGQLTNAVKEKPFCVLLFDEIEKAHGRILDKFLQILEDGRLTDGKGETVYFSETIIIFTSNIGAAEVDSNIEPKEVKKQFVEKVQKHFIEVLRRPE